MNGVATPPSAQLDPFVQYCVNELGIAVVAPGLRDGDAGALDLGALLAWIGAQPDMRRDRVMVQGRGAGGTLALTGLGLYGERLPPPSASTACASIAQIAPIRNPVLLVRGLHVRRWTPVRPSSCCGACASAHISSWFVAPRERRDALASEAEQAGAQRVIVQFVGSQLGG